MVDNNLDKDFEDEIDVMKRTPKKAQKPIKPLVEDVKIVEEPNDDSEAGEEKPEKVKSSSKNNDKEMKLKFGQSNDKKSIFISEKARFANVLILGAKNSGKSSTVLPMLAKQDLLNGNCGLTLVVDKKDVAYTLYAMAKDEGRHVTILKPSADFNIGSDFIQHSTYDYEYINKNIIDYKEAIKKKEVVIIDMEYAKYRQSAIRATAMLLMQLQMDMQDTQATLKRPHFVYIDDANRYLPFIELLLTSGDDYGVGTVLFMQGRSQLMTYDTDYSSLVDVNVRNTILMNGITFEDSKFYAERFFDRTLKDIVDRKEGQVLYEIIDSDFSRKAGQCGLVFITEATRKSIEEKAKKIRKQLNKYTRKVERDISLREEEELLKLNRIKHEKLNKVEGNEPAPELSKIAKDIIAIEEKQQQKEQEVKVVESAPSETVAPVKPKDEVEAIVQEILKEESTDIDSDLDKVLGSIGSKELNIELPGNDILSELDELNNISDLPDDDFGAYAHEEPVNNEPEEDSGLSAIEEAKKLVDTSEEEIIVINDTLVVDSMGDNYLQEVRGYRPIKKGMPRKKPALVESERYLNDILTQKLK